MSDVSRRTLLLGAGALGIAGLAVPVSSASGLSAGPLLARSSAPAAATSAPGLPDRSHFVPGLGARFQAAGEAGTHQLELVDILDVTATAGDRERSFNLIFAAAGAAPGEGVYRVEAAGVAAVDLFLSPIGGHTGRLELQALVNRSA